MPEVSKHEPHLALDGGRDGLDYYRRIAAEAPARLRASGLLALEIGEGQAEDVERLLREAFGRIAITLAKDLLGRPRAIVVER